MGQPVNFHNEISLRIESDARKAFPEFVNESNFRQTVFSADRVDSGMFAEAMLLILRWKYRFMRNDTLDCFSARASRYFGLGYSDIPSEEAAALFTAYRGLLETDNRA